jgi:hypothetical protein
MCIKGSLTFRGRDGVRVQKTRRKNMTLLRHPQRIVIAPVFNKTEICVNLKWKDGSLKSEDRSVEKCRTSVFCLRSFDKNLLH